MYPAHHNDIFRQDRGPCGEDEPQRLTGITAVKLFNLQQNSHLGPEFLSLSARTTSERVPRDARRKA